MCCEKLVSMDGKSILHMTGKKVGTPKMLKTVQITNRKILLVTRLDSRISSKTILI